VSWRFVVKLFYVLITMLLLLLSCGCQPDTESVSRDVSIQASSSGNDMIIPLPEPRKDSDVSIEQSLMERRSIRSYSGESLTLAEVAQILWAAQGITDTGGHRTAPSAGALYPLEMYLVTGNVKGLTAGIYRYQPEKHQLNMLFNGDCRDELSVAALSQSSVAKGAMSIVFSAIYGRTTVKYGERGIRYVHIELGHAAQNLCLQAVAMGLGVVTVGAFDDERVAEILGMPDDETPLYIIPVGRK
jgi:SagB-type dehydrogenase family enzyme